MKAQAPTCLTQAVPPWLGTVSGSLLLPSEWAAPGELLALDRRLCGRCAHHGMRPRACGTLSSHLLVLQSSRGVLGLVLCGLDLVCDT